MSLERYLASWIQKWMCFLTWVTMLSKLAWQEFVVHVWLMRKERAAGLTRSCYFIQRAARLGREPCWRGLIQAAAGLGLAKGHAGQLWSREHLALFRRFRPIPQWWRWMVWSIGIRFQCAVGKYGSPKQPWSFEWCCYVIGSNVLSCIRVRRCTLMFPGKEKEKKPRQYPWPLSINNLDNLHSHKLIFFLIIISFAVGGIFVTRHLPKNL